MTAASKVINRALQKLNVSSDISPISPQQMQSAFEILIDMINRWDAKNIKLGITIPANVNDDLGEPAYSTSALYYGLAIEVADDYQVEVPRQLFGNYEKHMSDLMVRVSPVAVSDFPDTLPTGSGFRRQRSRNQRVFFPTSESLITDTSTPIKGNT